MFFCAKHFLADVLLKRQPSIHDAAWHWAKLTNNPQLSIFYAPQQSPKYPLKISEYQRMRIEVHVF